jgi:hypothetical protein
MYNSPLLTAIKYGFTRGIASLENNLIVEYYLSASQIRPDNRGESTVLKCFKMIRPIFYSHQHTVKPAHAATSIQQSPFCCPVTGNFI